MFSLFKMFSVGALTCAELDGKGLGNGVKRIEFCRDISGNPTNEIELRIDLDEFRFMPDGWYDDMYEKLVIGKEPEKTGKDFSTPLDEIKAAIKEAIEAGRDSEAFPFIVRLNRRTLFDEVCRKKDPTNWKDVRTKDLVEELKTREGVKVTIAEPYEDKTVTVNGPAIMIVVTD